MKFAYAVAFCQLLAAAGLSAQTAEQTPANAHVFLTELASQNRIRFTVPDYYKETTRYSLHGNNGEYNIVPRKSRDTIQPWTLLLASSGGCKTTLHQGLWSAWKQVGDFETYSEKPSYVHQDRWVTRTIPGTETSRPFVAHWQHLESNGIDWSKVSTISDGGSGTLTLKGPAFSRNLLFLHFESVEMATRAAFALEVIRQSCDPVASTGF
jgi:hypothetical protein